MTLQEYADKYPLTDEERQREAISAEIMAQQAAANERRARETLERLAQEELKKEHEKALKADKEERKKEANRLTQEVYEGLCMGYDASKLLLKAVKALSLSNNRPQDYERLYGAFTSVYGVGFEQSDERQTEIKETNQRIERLQAKLEELQKLNNPRDRETMKDIKKGLELNKRRLKALQQQKEQPAQQAFTVEPAAENPFIGP